jgi:hypothetical protein
MVVVRITSGLGNQLFQYAAARRLAYTRNVSLKLDLEWFTVTNYRQFGLEHFNITAVEATSDEINTAKKMNYFKEKHYHFNPGLLEAESIVYLSGFWQSEKYFADIANLIRREFTLKDSLNEANSQMAQMVQNSEAIAVHIRRGDYLTNDNCYICPPEYYERAVEYLITSIPNAHFFIFSDDPKWTAANWKISYPTTLVTNNDEKKGFVDLYLMSLCRHHIIANSTFSWWGAWLSQYSAKQIVAPGKWFGKLQYNTCDLIPSAWHMI